jgi:DNA-3-methyladenine glycosylase II
MPIPTPAELIRARKALAAADPGLAVIEAAIPEVAWRSHEGGYRGLVAMITGQQVSTHAAAAIWKRFSEGVGAVPPRAVLGFDEATLKGFGLSTQKVRYVHGIAEACESGACDFDGIARMSDAEAVEMMIGMKGVGRWTAELYLLFCEGRMDVFPAGDLALQEGIRMADGHGERPNEKQLYARAEAWRPYRGMAAHMLWAYYGMIKRREIAPPNPAEMAL